MSNTKETPRQKMISMMYLVLTCLLALNVSREVLDGFVTINESIESGNAGLKGNTSKMMHSFNEAIELGHHEFIPYYSKAKQVTALTRHSFEYIEQLKKALKLYTEDQEGADTSRLGKLERLDDVDRPTYFLIGDDEAKPKTGHFSAIELRRTLGALTDSLGRIIEDMKDRDGLKLPDGDYLVLKNKIRALAPHDHFKDKEGKSISWEFRNFYNMPLAAAVTNLSKMQGDISNLEAEMVNTFAAASGKLSVKFDEMQARIVPVSNYVQTGTPYTADVFLTASSSDFKEDNLQFILGEVDTATGKVSDDAVFLPIDKGTGKVKLPTGAPGHKTVKGWIKFREGTGTYKYFSYENEYVVANSAVAVSPDKMNVFYAGIENPITVSAAGVAPGDLVVDLKGCNGILQNNSNGKYSVKVSGTGTCVIKVTQRTNEGLRPQGAPQVFRVKKIPNPPMKIDGKTAYGTLEMKVHEARNLTTVGVDNSGFEFNAPFRVTSFILYAVVNGMGVEIPCSGNTLSAQAKQALSKIKAGSKLYIENIKVEAPDGPREFPALKIMVK